MTNVAEKIGSPTGMRRIYLIHATSMTPPRQMIMSAPGVTLMNSETNIPNISSLQPVLDLTLISQVGKPSRLVATWFSAQVC